MMPDNKVPVAYSRLIHRLSVVADPRSARGRLHNLVDILAIIVVAVLCGCKNAEEIELWGRKEAAWLRTFLELPNGIPSQDTYLRVLAGLDAMQFRQAFLDWVTDVFVPAGLGGHIAIDGKSVRGSRSPAHNESPVHMVSALACETGLVIGQQRTADKANEIVAIPQVLRLLSLEGALVSVDAMGCQREIAEQIVDQGGDYLLQIKSNQPTLRADVETTFSEALDPRPRPRDVPSAPTVTWHEQTDGDHGRIEERKTAVCTDFGAYLSTANRWKQLRTVIRVERTTQDKNSGAMRTEHSYYMSSRVLAAQEAHEAIRRHWLIENQLHWSLDVTFGEDACQIRARNGAENLAVVRHLAYNLLRRYRGDKKSLKLRQRQCDWNLNYRLAVLAGTG